MPGDWTCMPPSSTLWHGITPTGLTFWEARSCFRYCGQAARGEHQPQSAEEEQARPATATRRAETMITTKEGGKKPEAFLCLGLRVCRQRVVESSSESQSWADAAAPNTGPQAPDDPVATELMAPEARLSPEASPVQGAIFGPSL
ncbi:hypothetical protein EYF80_023273 [Liparis tanakae]|uniref:Uncharacterized protein n=1 Tax=Liparis tanakae TaxID=230148 RepID=A0A4Z2HLP5_9TELE|nr:hypothetical protein EYF80_023273 [Liparis tanakae]